MASLSQGADEPHVTQRNQWAVEVVHEIRNRCSSKDQVLFIPTTEVQFGHCVKMCVLHEI